MYITISFLYAQVITITKTIANNAAKINWPFVKETRNTDSLFMPQKLLKNKSGINPLSLTICFNEMFTF